MTDRAYETTTAFHELIDLIREADQQFLTGPRAVADEVSVVEGYRWLTEVLSVALDCYLWADTARPTIVPIVGPTRKFGGDNADAFYDFAPLDPRRTYRLRGTRGDAVYLSITVYGGPTDGRWSNRIVGTLNDRHMAFAPDGSFEVLLGAEERPGNFLRLDPDTVCLVTRDYVVDPTRARKATWHIEAQVTYGWAAADAAYAMGAFDLADGEALVIEGTSPPCAFWNMCLWNPFLQTYDYRYERVTINGGQVRHEADGSWRIVVAARDPGVQNWVSTAGHRRGRIWFRWFLPEAQPARPTTRVVPLSQLVH